MKILKMLRKSDLYTGMIVASSQKKEIYIYILCYTQTLINFLNNKF